MDWDLYLTAHPTDRFDRYIQPDEPAWERSLSLVGRIVRQAARVEAILGGLASVGAPGMNVTFVDTELDWSPHGASGNPLIDALRSLSERSPAVKNVTDRYAAWAPIRNQLIHGVWMHENHETGSFELSKPSKGFQKKPLDDGKLQPFILAKLGQADLIEIAYAFYGLGEDASRIQIQAMSGTPIEEWPFPNYAPESRWWPPGWTASSS